MTSGQRAEFSRYGAVDVLRFAPQERPRPQSGEVLVQVVAAGVSHMDVRIRAGLFTDQVPLAFPATSGSCFAGIVRDRGHGVTIPIKGEVFGHDPANAAHANWVVVPTAAVVEKPASMPWEVAGGLYLAGATAVTVIDGLHLTAADVLLVTAAAGGVGHLECQLARRAGAVVLGVAAVENHDYLRSIGVVPVAHGDGLRDRIRAAAKGRDVTALVDNHGSYDELPAVLGIPTGRFSTSADRGRIELRYYLASEAEPGMKQVLRRLVDLTTVEGVRPLISGFYGFEHLQEAVIDLESGHGRGKVVVGMRTVAPAGNYLGTKLRALHAQRSAKQSERDGGRAT